MIGSVWFPRSCFANRKQEACDQNSIPNVLQQEGMSHISARLACRERGGGDRFTAAVLSSWCGEEPSPQSPSLLPQTDPSMRWRATIALSHRDLSSPVLGLEASDCSLGAAGHTHVCLPGDPALRFLIFEWISRFAHLTHGPIAHQCKPRHISAADPTLPARYQRLEALPLSLWQKQSSVVRIQDPRIVDEWPHK